MSAKQAEPAPQDTDLTAARQIRHHTAGHAGWHKAGPTEWTPDGLGVGIGRSEPGESADTGQETASPATVGAETASGVHQDTPRPASVDLDAIETRANAAWTPTAQPTTSEDDHA